MGGNAFPSTRRLSRSERYRVFGVVHSALSPIARCSAPLELADKVTFGDVDFVVCGDGARDAARAALASALGCTEPFAACGPHDSFLTPERFQVDVTYCAPELFDMHVAFMSHGDFAMIVSVALGGRVILSQHGFRTRLHKVMLSADPVEVSRFLGLPEPGRPMTKAEMFASVVGARFLDTAALARMRRANTLKRRAAFVEFQDLAADLPPRVPGDVLELALDHFGKRAEYEAAVAEDELAARRADAGRRCKAILSGRDVQELLPGIDGPGVGRVLQAVRGDRSPEEHLAYLQAATRDDLRRAVLAAARS